MDLNKINFPDLTPHINTSLIDEMNKHTQEMLDNITPFNEVLADELKPILECNQKVIDGLAENYNKLNELYLLKEKELAESKDEAEKAKKYNTKMLVIAYVSAGIALASLVASIFIAVH